VRAHLQHFAGPELHRLALFLPKEDGCTCTDCKKQSNDALSFHVCCLLKNSDKLSRSFDVCTDMTLVLAFGMLLVSFSFPFLGMHTLCS
jgi:hypothetical protein